MSFLPWLFLFLGIISRILVPWLIARRDDPTLPWSWLYVWPQLVSFVVVALMLPLLVSDLNEIGYLELQIAFFVGWGAADVGNTGRKFLTRNGDGGKS